jgi:hypothetical protein
MEEHWNCVSLLLASNRSTLIDIDDYEWASQFSWCAPPAGRRKNLHYVIRSRTGASPTSMHRSLMNAVKGEIVDHRNGNTLDNRRANLRKCTKSENKRNTFRYARAVKGKPYKGIGQDKRYPDTYYAAVYVDGKKITCTKFKTPEEAARGYDRLALQYYGEFAALNFPSAQFKIQEEK